MQKSKITDNSRRTSTADLDCISKFKEIRTQNFNNVIIGNHNINCNWTRTHNYLVHKRTLNHLAKLAK